MWLGGAGMGSDSIRRTVILLFSLVAVQLINYEDSRYQPSRLASATGWVGSSDQSRVINFTWLLASFSWLSWRGSAGFLDTQSAVSSLLSYCGLGEAYPWLDGCGGYTLLSINILRTSITGVFYTFYDHHMCFFSVEYIEKNVAWRYTIHCILWSSILCLSGW